MATRNAGQMVMNAIAEVVPELFGGAADLTSSTKTIFKPSAHFADDAAGRNVFFGVREVGNVRGGERNGGSWRADSHSDRPSLCFPITPSRRCALRRIMEVHSLFVFTHDSIGVGEDGPTHEPIEHLMALRAVPHMTDFRPADANETAAAWRLALERKGPCFFALTRQDLPVIDASTRDMYARVSKGAYVLEDAANPQVVLIGTGSEVSLAGQRPSCWRPRESGRAWSAFRVGGSSRSNRPRTKPVCCRRACPSWRSKPERHWAGGSMWARTVTWSGWTGSALRRRDPVVMKELGFTAENVAARAKKLVIGTRT